MKLSLKGNKITPEYDNALWWGTECLSKLKERLEKICPNSNPMGNNNYGNDSKIGIHTFGNLEGGLLNKHSDGEGSWHNFYDYT